MLPSVGQLTVVFCDLEGSTALWAKLDPEDRRGIIAIHYHWLHRVG
jgi:class 3 adenylate cyclase